MKAVIAGCVVILALVACRSSNTTNRPPRSVTYEVTGENRIGASLTYTNETGGTEQRTVGIPWTRRFTVKPGQFLYLSAQNADEYGSVTVRINIDGQTVKTSTSQGGFAIASANYRCCD